jgi:hypothetical protein
MDKNMGAEGDGAYYEVRIQGTLDPQWSTWFDGLTITYHANGDTTLYGPVVDQAALYGLIGKLRDLGLTLLSVARNEPDEGVEYQ